MNELFIIGIITLVILVVNHYAKPYYMPWLWGKAFELTTQIAIKKLLLEQRRQQELQEKKNNNNKD